jgi:hypothetical protein
MPAKRAKADAIKTIELALDRAAAELQATHQLDSVVILASVFDGNTTRMFQSESGNSLAAKQHIREVADAQDFADDEVPDNPDADEDNDEEPPQA